jgi:DNA-binding transcriptional LysR family regulator
MLEEGSLDLGFLRMPFAGSPGVDVVPIHQEPFVAVVPSSHPLARKSVVRLRETANEIYVLYERAHAPGFHDLVLGILNRASVIPAVWQVAGEMPTLISLIPIFHRARPPRAPRKNIQRHHKQMTLSPFH